DFVVRFYKDINFFIPTQYIFSYGFISELLFTVGACGVIFGSGSACVSITKIDYIKEICMLNYPNEEVKKSFLIHIAANYFYTPVTVIRPLYIDLHDFLCNNNIERFITIIKSLIAKIPYQLHIPKEAYYHSIFYLIMELMGIKMDTEISTSKGRIDGVIEFENNIYIIEFKYLAENKNIDEVLNMAISQIKTKKYFTPYLIKDKPINYLAIVVNKEIVEYKIENKS
ncbi:MAG: PD-(D/E)XK nuclease domain-containing protein, partial [bacterium]